MRSNEAKSSDESLAVCYPPGAVAVVFPEDLASRLEPLDGAMQSQEGEALAEMLAGFESAAVVAIVLPGDEDRLVLIERSGMLRSHAGQLAFPGGKREPGDENLLHTALREAEEEVGLEPGDATVLGRLFPVPTPTRYVIQPFVVRARPGWEPQPRSPEVARLVMPTLAQLADPSLHRVTGRGMWFGYAYVMHEFAIHDPPLWGATARMTWDLLQRIGR
jgi:8-oxo-dGTP pyrophosphatase MutT (NUDIX family)